MRQGHEDQESRADDEQVNAKVKQQHAREMDLAEERQMKVRGERGEEWKLQPPGTQPRACGCEQPEADPDEWMNAKARLDPDGASHHVLRDDGRCHDEAADESSTRCMMPI